MYCYCTVEFYIYLLFNSSKSFFLLACVFCLNVFYVLCKSQSFLNSESCYTSTFALLCIPAIFWHQRVSLSIPERVISYPQSPSYPIWCHAFLALTCLLCCMHIISWLGQCIKLLQHAEGNLVEQNCPIHYFSSLRS